MYTILRLVQTFCVKTCQSKGKAQTLTRKKTKTRAMLTADNVYFRCI